MLPGFLLPPRRFSLPLAWGVCVLLAGCGARSADVAPDVRARRVVEKSVEHGAAAPVDSTKAPPSLVSHAAAPAMITGSRSGGGRDDAAARHDDLRFAGASSVTVAAKVMGRHITLKSDRAADLAGLLCTDGSVAGGEYHLTVARLASFGRADSPVAFQWVLSVPEKEGSLTARRSGKGLEVELTGRFELLVMLRGATKSFRVVSREMTVLRGTAKRWPPVGARLSLANGPVALFREGMLGDSAAVPLVTVEGAEITIGGDTSGYFDGAPRIVAARGEGGGVSLGWRGTPGVDAASIDGYNIYRSDALAGPRRWTLLASVPATQTTYHDPAAVAGAAYMIAHRAPFPMGFQYEGMPSAPRVARGRE